MPNGRAILARYPWRMSDNRATAVLRRGQRVRLEDEAGIIYVSEVAAVDDDTMALRLLDEAPDEAFMTGSTAFVGIAGPQGLSRMKVVVGGRSEGATVDLTPLGEFELLQRRRQPRVAVDMKLPCRRYRASGPVAMKPLHTEDLSAGGLRAVSAERAATGDVLELDLPLRDETITVKALVVTTDEDEKHWTLHIAFTQVTQEAKRAIERFVSQEATTS
ncbi:MAG: PilZ domain [Acidimicrobiaceae bacterium]|jgi:c-di-GMP-binding flagellar brake protein YcgR|nr:PilZ domain [Acidimicrobiaceae bacterium]